MRIAGWIGLIVAGIPVGALAQAPPGMIGTQIRGTVQAADPHSLTVLSDSGPLYKVMVPPDARVQGVAAASITDIQVGSYVGSGATKDATGKFTAREVHIFAMPGIGEGQRAMDSATHIMTNAAVTAITSTPPGETITLTFGTRSQPIYLPPHVPVVSLSSAKLSDVVLGSKVRLQAMKTKSGDLEAGMVMLSVNGAMLP